MTAFENLQELIDLLDDAPGVTELTVTGKGGALITVKRRPSAVEVVSGEYSDYPPTGAGQSYPGSGDSASPNEIIDLAVAEERIVAIAANRVGVFHPARPGIEIGETVSVGQIVGYIESMKLMNEVRAEHGGRVDEQLIEENVPVEYGQPLFHIALV